MIVDDLCFQFCWKLYVSLLFIFGTENATCIAYFTKWKWQYSIMRSKNKYR